MEVFAVDIYQNQPLRGRSGNHEAAAGMATESSNLYAALETDLLLLRRVEEVLERLD